ncbi:hypothetical protein D3C75_907490 [compost metagenome]
MLKSVLIEPGADRMHESVHHIGWRDNIRPRFSLGHCRAGQKVQRSIVDHIAVHHTIHRMGMNHAAMAVIREFTQTGIRNYEQLRVPFFNQACGFLHNAILSERRGADRILGFGNPEQQHSRYTQRCDLVHFRLQRIQRKMVHARHRADFTFHTCTISHKDRLDEIQRIQDCLPHHAADSGRSAQTAVSCNWKTHRFILLYSRYLNTNRVMHIITIYPGQS